MGRKSGRKPHPTQFTVTSDPVCGRRVRVSPDSRYRALYRDTAFTFCSEDCLNQFTSNPAGFVRESDPTSPPKAD